MTQSTPPYILGLDIGTSSLGWALIGLDTTSDEGGTPGGILDMGVRIFPAGVDGTDDDIAQGRDESRNTARRGARQQRRQIWRRKRRKALMYNTLHRHGLLPATQGKDETARHRALNALDLQLRDTHLPTGGDDPRAAHLLPYILRTRALDQALEPHALGRALLHLGQRRGFLSNKKSSGGDEDGVVYEGIGQLVEAIRERGVRTLGEYFSTIDPEGERRIRQRWTARSMYLDEFKKIWAAQAHHHPTLLTETARREIHRAIFYQRPLKSQKNKIGICDLEPERHRTAWARPEAQEFRLLQKVNDLRIVYPDHTERTLTEAERATVIGTLMHDGDRTFNQIKKRLGFKRNECKFNLQAGGETKMMGHRTFAQLAEHFGPLWQTFSPEQRHEIAVDLLSISSEATFQKRAIHHGLNRPTAQHLAHNFKTAPGYCALSLKALRTLLPDLRKGTSYMTARLAHYPPKQADLNALLPPVTSVLPQLSNPTVLRCLTELRKVVNAVVRVHGKPDLIRIELARDLKRGRKQRINMAKRNRDRQKQRDKAHKLCVEAGITNPKRRDIEKVLLAVECAWVCPYSGAPIAVHSLLGPQPAFDIEHIIPYSRSFDNGFLNKTLCRSDINRNIKRNRTPFETWAHNESEWTQILDRVERFQGDAAEFKAKRFRMNPEQVAERLENFTSRQLNDTRYASTLAVDYLSTLYGATAGIMAREGESERPGKRVISPVAGQVTATVRRALGVNGLLNDDNMKSRDDHRHHTVDALVVALTNHKLIKEISDIAKRCEDQYSRIRIDLDEPWPGFMDEVVTALNDVNVSRRVDHRLQGALHKETNYGRITRQTDDGEVESAVVRKRLEVMTSGEASRIVDEAVRAAVFAAMERAETKDPKKAFAKAENAPRMADGTPIRKARFWTNAPLKAIGTGHRQRWNQSGANHHLELWACTDKKGQPKWEGEVVSLLEAIRRQRVGEPVIQRDHGEGTTWVCSLMKGDVVELVRTEGRRELFVVRKFSVFSSGRLQIGLGPIRDARKVGDLIKTKILLRIGATQLLAMNCQKINIDPIGQIHPAND